MSFKLGTIVHTPGFATACGESLEPTIRNLLARHTSGDWGDLCDEDRQMNDEALENGSRLLSTYEVNDNKVFVITEWDRSVTTLLLPSEY